MSPNSFHRRTITVLDTGCESEGGNMPDMTAMAGIQRRAGAVPEPEVSYRAAVLTIDRNGGQYGTSFENRRSLYRAAAVRNRLRLSASRAKPGRRSPSGGRSARSGGYCCNARQL